MPYWVFIVHVWTQKIVLAFHTSVLKSSLNLIFSHVTSSLMSQPLASKLLHNWISSRRLPLQGPCVRERDQGALQLQAKHVIFLV
jgi:hypothetical protein